MEYLGYVAANNPPPNYYLRRAPPPQPPQNPTPTTVTSTTGTFPLSGGQPRTNSSNSSRSRSSHETGPPAFLGATTFTRHENQSHPSPVSIQGDQLQDRYQQPQLPPPYKASPIGNHHKELPPTPAPSALIGGLDFDVTLQSPLHTAVTIDGATHLLATPVTSSIVLPLDHSPARSSYPSQAVGTAQSMRSAHLRTVATPKRKIQKFQKSSLQERTLTEHGQQPYRRGKIGHQQQEQPQYHQQRQQQQQQQQQQQEGQLEQQREYRRQQRQNQEQDQDQNQDLEQDQEQLHGQYRRNLRDKDQRPNSRRHRHRELGHPYEYEHEHLRNRNYALESKQNRAPGDPQKQPRQQKISSTSVVPGPNALYSESITKSFARNDNNYRTSGFATLGPKTMLPSEPPSSADGGGSSSQSLLSTAFDQTKPFLIRNGRTYLSDPSLPYPLPVDLEELHRQSLRSLLLFQLFGGPVCSPSFANRPPTRVLEVGCGSAFWSIMCNQYYARQGHRGISFSGIDIAPIGLGAKGPDDIGLTNQSVSGKEKGQMNWRFVQHDVRRLPWPFEVEEFDLIMIKDVSLAMRSDTYQLVFDECIRLLQPGGTLEVWDSDHAIRLLRPHIPSVPATPSAQEEDDYNSAMTAGAYVLTPNTPLSAPLNSYIVEYNAWLVKALESRSLPFAQCALAGALFLQEAESLTNVSSRRLAVPLSEMRWEREGVGGVVTKDGKPYIETKNVPKAKGQSRDLEPGIKTITPAQTALRRTALLTVVQLIQSLEPILREVSGKSQDEWDGWSGKMVNDLMRENGTFWGECLEVGAWWAQKR